MKIVKCMDEMNATTDAILLGITQSMITATTLTDKMKKHSPPDSTIGLSN